MAALHSRLDSGKFDTREAALDAYVLSRVYDYTGNKPMRLKYLIMPAMADIRGSVREMVSLEEVARILAGEGDFERANDYVNYCIGCASGYRSRIRMVHLGRLKDQILTSLYRHSQEQGELNRKMVLVLIIVVIVPPDPILLSLLLVRMPAAAANLHRLPISRSLPPSDVCLKPCSLPASPWCCSILPAVPPYWPGKVRMFLPY